MLMQKTGNHNIYSIINLCVSMQCCLVHTSVYTSGYCDAQVLIIKQNIKI